LNYCSSLPKFRPIPEPETPSLNIPYPYDLFLSPPQYWTGEPCTPWNIGETPPLFNIDTPALQLDDVSSAGTSPQIDNGLLRTPAFQLPDVYNRDPAEEEAMGEHLFQEFMGDPTDGRDLDNPRDFKTAYHPLDPAFGEVQLVQIQQNEEGVSCLEKRGTTAALGYCANNLRSIGHIVHDECSSTENFINSKVKGRHPQCSSKGDTWHGFKNVVKEAKENFDNNPFYEGFSKKIQAILRSVILKYHSDTPESEKARIAVWIHYNFLDNWKADLTQSQLEDLGEFMKSTSSQIAKLVPYGTSACESYNNHNLVFFSKRHYYAPQIWIIKMYAAYLEWNQVPNWFQKFTYDVLTEIKEGRL
jgi:hypothetical protein